MIPTVLIVDDDPDYGPDLAALLSPDFACRFAANGEQGLQAIAADPPDAVVLDLMLEGGRNGLDVLSSIREQHPSLPVIMATDYPSAETEAEALGRGALYYVRKAAGRTEVVSKLRRCIEVALTARERDRLRRQIGVGALHGEFLCHSVTMREMDARIERIAAAANTTVLITGESGTGKSLVAREIHRRSPRRDERFLEINLSLLTENVARSDLFGHRKGSFTGADQDKQGCFEAAKGGTICLSEVADLSSDLQGLLLQAIEERQIFPIGSPVPRLIDVRVVATTNRNLEEMVNDGGFRADLLGRLSVVTIHVPPLREHLEDIPVLAKEFLQRSVAEMPLPGVTITPEAMEHLRSYSWRRNNVRELRNRIEAAVVLHGVEGMLKSGAFDLPADDPAAGFDYNEEKSRVVRDFQRRFFERAFRAIGSSLADPRAEDTRRIAELTALPPHTVRRILRELG
jgi:DNA-binding NtrC family response regulator